MVNKCCLQNTSWEIVNVLARLQFERDESKGARSLDSSRSNGPGETWEEYSTPWIFFSFPNFFLNIIYKNITYLCCEPLFTISRFMNKK